MQVIDKKPSFNARLQTFDSSGNNLTAAFSGERHDRCKISNNNTHPQPPKATGCVDSNTLQKRCQKKSIKKYPIIGEFSQKISKAETSELPKILEDAVKKLGKEIDVEV